MPYCSQCGNQVGEADAYCGRCGSRQPTAPPAPSSDFLSSLSPRTASVLCYIPLIGWIAAIVVLAAERFRDNRNVRFHAFQGIYIFVAWLIVDHVLGPMFGFVRYFPLAGLFRAAILGLWIFMIVKASQEEAYSLPIIGELAERSVAER